ncbi:hypothetical protein WOLCODRAFT_16953 [Wolfiporia cocos MD-104 SS10]|uniref:ATPase AAA-type core domain-containing protein n=1 Tax=Wolfiporia cocos (strain MD-104) TaxID=742152 RepID=A0A2H3JG77_WOLCO|nr:hypothetical protein WOLCODRAFT_16953 [Wolfiporia cocos MD-104 SS10]
MPIVIDSSPIKPSIPTASPSTKSVYSTSAPRGPMPTVIRNIFVAHTIKRLLDLAQDQGGPDSGSSHELWTYKWRPKRAEQVIGNEDHALYLRAWLLALKLHIETPPTTSGAAGGRTGKQSANDRIRGTKRPKVLRQVDKRRKRKRLISEEPDDSWIVDDESEGSTQDRDSEEDEFAFCQRTLSRLQRVSEEAEHDASSDSTTPPHEAEAKPTPSFSYSSPQFGNQIHNTILLHGPPGSGKTAAVYACAEELGWDVLEVYPGIGERSGADLNKLVGEVGKNHLVKQTQRQPKLNFFGLSSSQASDASSNISQPRQPGRRRFNRVDSENTEKEPDFSGAPSPHNTDDTSAQSPSVSQCIVLFEEVDILFESDTNFWPAMINIIKDCRRPVVMTCNGERLSAELHNGLTSNCTDISLIPVRDLPLQEILTFAACPVPLAASYLQCLTLLEHRPIGRLTVSQLYERADEDRPAIVSSRALHPSAPMPDLRRAIHQLQFAAQADHFASTEPGDMYGSTDPSRPLDIGYNPDFEIDRSKADTPTETKRREDLWTTRRMDQHQTIMSFADCYLHRRDLDVLTDSILADARVADDELGYTVLRGSDSTSGRAIPVDHSYYHQDDLTAEEALSGYQSRLGHMPPLPADLLGYTASAREYAAQMVAILADLQVPADVLMGSSPPFLDYDPWLRYMVAVDDANAAASLAAQVARGGTRRTRNSQKSVQGVRYVPISESNRGTLARTALSGE